MTAAYITTAGPAAEDLDLDDAGDLWATLSAFAPRDRCRTLDWATRYIVNEEGRPYDHAAFPHLGAPGGPLDAFDESRVREIVMQWGSRLGKTFAGHVCVAKSAHTDPCPTMIAGSVQAGALACAQRVYKILGARPALAKLMVKSERLRKEDRIELAECIVHVAWSRSVTSLADKNVRLGHANEYDKWEHASTSKEGHPHKLFSERFKDYWGSRKIIMESTPTVAGRSGIEAKRLAGTNCRYHVPCPHCGAYQPLEMEQLKWETPKGCESGGTAACKAAAETARYECRACGGEWRDHHRPRIMRGGVWAPEGCPVDPAEAAAAASRWAEAADRAAGGDGPIPDATDLWDGWASAAWVEGAPPSGPTLASYQLSSLYALSLGWGDVAAEFVASKNDPAKLRNFKNGWEGLTWENRRGKQKWEAVAGRIASDVPRGIVPAWAKILTFGVDRQGDRWVWKAVAWGEGERSHIVDYGEPPTAEDLIAVAVRGFERPATEGVAAATFRPSLTLVDTGFNPESGHKLVADLKALGLPAYACRGSKTKLPAAYKIVRNGPNTSAPGVQVVEVDSFATQEWVGARLAAPEDDAEPTLTIPAGSAADLQDLVEQLLNEVCEEDLDANDHVVGRWVRADTNVPNDLRDCLRYALAALRRHLRGRELVEEPGPEAREPGEDATENLAELMGGAASGW